MENEKIDGLLNRIGNILATDSEYPLNGTFLYAEAEDAMVAPSVFKDLGDHLLYRFGPSEIGLAILDLWYAFPSDKRWAAVEYRIGEGRFEVSFVYPSELDPKESEPDRRERVLRARFGNKRINYPSMDDYAAWKRADGSYG